MFAPLPMTESTLESLLNEGSEHANLDYKTTCDLDERRKVVEIVKDLGAMQIHGGYVIVGADDDGKPSGELTADQAKLFDEARLRPKIERYLAGFDIRTKEFEIDGKHLVLIRVHPHPDGWAVFQADGGYTDAKGKSKFAFRHGDVFTRHGSSSERWDQSDAQRIREEIRRQEREDAKKELRDDYTDLLNQGNAARAAAQAPIGTLTLDLDPETLNAAVIEAIRSGDTIPVTLLLKSAPARVIEFAKAGGPAVDNALDRLIGIAATLMTINQTPELHQVIRAVEVIYNATFDASGLDRRDLRIAPDDLRFRIVTRVYALGALSVREERWADVRRLVAVRPKSHDGDYWQNWLFHADIAAARAGYHDHAEVDQGKQPYKSTLLFAQEHIVRLPELRPDVAIDDEQIVTSLCQFSMLACFVAISEPKGKKTGAFLAHFGRWFATRTDPIVVELIQGGPMRDAIFAGDNDELAAAIRGIASNAQAMAQSIHDWHGFEDPRIHEFLIQHS